jgi:Uncharacterised nucleotidyltransferase
LGVSAIEIQSASPEALRQKRPAAPYEAALLITCLRGLACIVPDDTDWDELLRLALKHGVLPLIYQSLFEQGAKMPAFFIGAAQQNRIAARKLASELEGLLGDFAEQGIEVLPLKGPAMAEALYGDVALRPSVDLDLLVRRRDYRRAEALLSDKEFTSCPVGDYNRKFRRGGLSVELHFKLASPQFCSFDVEPIWARCHRDAFRARPIRVMDAEDLVLYLCVHGLKHGFARLIWIKDLALALNRIEHQAYAGLMERARREGLEPWLLIGLEVVREMFPQQLQEAIDAAIDATSPRATTRARRAAKRLFAEGLKVSLKDHREFYLQAEPSAYHRWRYRLRYFTLTGTDYEWANRNHVPRGLMLLVRPFRVIRKYGPARIWQIIFP